VRPASPPLRGAKITGFETSGDNYKLSYEINGDKRAILYSVKADGTVPFEFQNGREGTTKEVYTRRQRGGGPSNPPDENRRPRESGGNPDRRGGPPPDERPREVAAPNAAAVNPLLKPNESFVLTSPEVTDGGNLPTDYTGDGSGATLPLDWKGAPAGTKSYAIIMDHLAPGNVMKSYWVVWDIPTAVTSVPKNMKDIGKVGISFKGQLGYEPPHSQGPGAKTYVLTVYALSAPAQVAQPPREVTREALLTAMKDKVLATASLRVVYTRGGNAPDDGARPSRRENGPQSDARPAGSETVAAAAAPATEPPPPRPGGEGRGPGKPDNKGLIKPTMADTVHVNVYADNWFVMFINGELVAVDSIKFTPHNVVSLDILPEYPMTIAIMAKDNADPKTGLEYGDHIGDGGFIIKFSDGTVSNATWKVKNFFKGPLDRDTKNPRVEHTPIPDKWWTADFDDKSWPNATGYTEQRVNPKEPFYQSDFAGAKFIWSDDLDLDNTVIFRTKIEKPGWKPRWNTHPDLDITEAPFK
jgi:phosphatidylethanolamine-binding protein (PEBP) family uncharacterized protein